MMTHGTAASRMADLCAAIEIVFATPSGEMAMEVGVEEDVAELREQILEYVKLDLLFLLRVREFRKVVRRCSEFGLELLVREVEDREGG